ncbi:MAG: transcription elongation factor Spt5 [Promethearchaeota archaeon]
MKLSEIVRTTQIFAVKTSIAHEKGVAEMIFHKLRSRVPKPDIKSILVIDQLRGYIFIEAPHQRDVMIATNEIHHVKGKTIGQIKLEELDKFLSPESITESLGTGDKVEITGGIFEGERAYVTSIDNAKDEVTLSLLGSDNPIPIKVHVDYLKIIEKGHHHGMQAGEATMVGHGIKEYSFDKESSQSEEDVETFPDNFDEAEVEKEMPEVYVHDKKKQKMVGEKFELNEDIFDDDDEYEDDLEFDEFDDFDVPDEEEKELDIKDSEKEEDEEDWI